jgi:hypothetical protein
MSAVFLWLVFEASFREVVCQPLVAEILTVGVLLGVLLFVAVAFSGGEP